MFQKIPVSDIPSLTKIQGPNLSTKTEIKPFSFGLNPEQPIICKVLFCLIRNGRISL